MALALRGLDVVCADRDEERLRTLIALAPDYMEKTWEVGHIASSLHPIIQGALAMQARFSAITCIHLLSVDLLPLFGTSLVAGGHLYIETFGGHGQNYLDLPNEGQLQDAVVAAGFQLLFYRERKVGPANSSAVWVKLLAQKSIP